MTLRTSRSAFFILLAAAACGGKAATANTDDSSRGDGDGDSGNGDGDGDGNFGDGDSGDGDFGDGDGDGDSGDGDGDIDTSCTTTRDCVLVNAECCAPCTLPTASDVTAIHFNSIDAHRAAVCAAGDVCPDCLGGTNPRLYAVCASGKCEVRDLATDPATECTSADECVLVPDACCECGAGNSPEEIVAINASRARNYRESQCSGQQGDTVSCLDCEWTAPEDIEPICAQEHCSFTMIEDEP